MLRGRFSARVDEKGRLKIPADFLEALKQYGTQFYITSWTGESARINPMAVWAEMEEKLARGGSLNRAKGKFLTRRNYFAQVVKLIGRGRARLRTGRVEPAEWKA